MQPNSNHIITNHNLHYITPSKKKLSQQWQTQPQAKLPVLNWHNQNPNITTVETLIVLLQ